MAHIRACSILGIPVITGILKIPISKSTDIRGYFTDFRVHTGGIYRESVIIIIITT